MIAEKYRTSLFFFWPLRLITCVSWPTNSKSVYSRTLVLFEDSTFFEVKDPVFDIRFGLLIT